jgi:hypothetical protein
MASLIADIAVFFSGLTNDSRTFITIWDEPECPKDLL